MPTINLENCTKCLKCVRDCPSEAIDIDKGTINDLCIQCGHCVAICPEFTVYPDSDEIRKLQPSSVSASEFRKLTAGIRTCRSYKDKSIESETLNLLLGNMAHYSSASNARPVEITIIKSVAEIRSLNDQTANTLIKRIKYVTSPILKPVIKIAAPKIDVTRLDNYKKQFIARQTPESSQVCHHAPVVMLFHAPISKYGMASADAYIWATYTSIYANILGLGTCFNGFIVNAMQRSKIMRNEFRIPADNQVYSALLLGYPKVKYTNEAGRNMPESIII